jgi:hypothetical protein
MVEYWNVGIMEPRLVSDMKIWIAEDPWPTKRPLLA